MSNAAYVYVLRDPRNFSIRYVGRTINPEKRFKEHLSNLNEGKLRIDWINELKSVALKPVMEIVEVCSESMVVEREDEWIGRLISEGHPLCNVLRRRLNVAPSIGVGTIVDLETHARLAQYAKSRDISLREVIKEAVYQYAERLSEKETPVAKK